MLRYLEFQLKKWMYALRRWPAKVKSIVFWPYCRGRAFSCAGLGTKALRRPGGGRPCWEATSSLTMLAA